MGKTEVYESRLIVEPKVTEPCSYNIDCFFFKCIRNNYIIIIVMENTEVVQFKAGSRAKAVTIGVYITASLERTGK